MTVNEIDHVLLLFEDKLWPCKNGGSSIQANKQMLRASQAEVILYYFS